MKPNTVRRAFVASLPVMAGYLVLGMGFGILLSAKGYSAWWSLLMSGCIYAGSMQYVAVDLLAGGASLLTAALTALMVNARHLFYGASMLERYRGAGKAKPYLIFALTDETYSLLCADSANNDNPNRHRYDLLVSLFNQLYWVIGSVVGGLLGSALPFNIEGIDFALTALFVSIFVEQWLTTKDRTAAILGVVCSAVSLLVFGRDNFLIPAMIAIGVSLFVLQQRRKGAGK